jgi:predicted acylesterase/phospholipase RssA
VQGIKDVLYVHLPERRERLYEEMRAAGIVSTSGGAKGWLYWPSQEAGVPPVRLRVASIADGLGLFGTQYFSLLVVDTRGGDGTVCAQAADLIDELQRDIPPERAFPRSRILVVLDECRELPRRTFELGRRQIRAVVTRPFEDGELREEIEALLSRERKVGKVALCLSGGAVEGLLFELGVLRALNAYLENRSITECDIFCGISAGSILASLLANGVEPIEIIHGLEGREGGIEPIGPRLIYDIDATTLAAQALKLYRVLVGSPDPDQLASRLVKLAPLGIFRGERIEAMLERELTKPGRTNNFNQIKPELYIGATDLDTFDHKVFGLPDSRHVPISRAVRASCGLMPFYGPTVIDGRYYVDGQYTRTANFHLAVELGATLILVLDPLVPLRADRAGYVAEKGGVFASIQGLKSLIHTRFTNAMKHAAEAYPDVDFHVFTPEDEDMKVLAGSPLKYTVRTQIIDVAYRCAVEKIQDRTELLRKHMARHGFRVRRTPRPR